MKDIESCIKVYLADNDQGRELLRKIYRFVEELKEENEQLKADIAFLERKFLSMTDIFAYNLKDQQALLERNNFSRNEIWEDFNLYRQNKTQREKGKEVKK